MSKTPDEIKNILMMRDSIRVGLEEIADDTNWLDDMGQSFTEFDYEGSHYQAWIEDAKSLGLKLNVMKENNLAGAAFWKLGLETDSAWDVINEYLQ